MNHENNFRTETAEGSSNRSFGLVSAAFFLVVALTPLASGRQIRYWWLSVGICLLLLSLYKPSFLEYPNRWWTAVGSIVSRVMNPIILAVLFFTVLVPYALVLKMCRSSQLDLGIEPETGSYWKRRCEKMQDMSHQF